MKKACILIESRVYYIAGATEKRGEDILNKYVVSCLELQRGQVILMKKHEK